MIGQLVRETRTFCPHLNEAPSGFVKVIEARSL